MHRLATAAERDRLQPVALVVVAQISDRTASQIAEHIIVVELVETALHDLVAKASSRARAGLAGHQLVQFGGRRRERACARRPGRNALARERAALRICSLDHCALGGQRPCCHQRAGETAKVCIEREVADEAVPVLRPAQSSRRPGPLDHRNAVVIDSALTPCGIVRDSEAAQHRAIAALQSHAGWLGTKIPGERRPIAVPILDRTEPPGSIVRVDFRPAPAVEVKLEPSVLPYERREALGRGSVPDDVALHAIQRIIGPASTHPIGAIDGRGPSGGVVLESRIVPDSICALAPADEPTECVVDEEIVSSAGTRHQERLPVASIHSRERLACKWEPGHEIGQRDDPDVAVLVELARHDAAAAGTRTADHVGALGQVADGVVYKRSREARAADGRGVTVLSVARERSRDPGCVGECRHHLVGSVLERECVAGAVRDRGQAPCAVVAALLDGAQGIRLAQERTPPRQGPIDAIGLVAVVRDVPARLHLERHVVVRICPIGRRSTRRRARGDPPLAPREGRRLGEAGVLDGQELVVRIVAVDLHGSERVGRDRAVGGRAALSSVLEGSHRIPLADLCGSQQPAGAIVRVLHPLAFGIRDRRQIATAVFVAIARPIRGDVESVAGSGQIAGRVVCEERAATGAIDDLAHASGSVVVDREHGVTFDRRADALLDRRGVEGSIPLQALREPEARIRGTRPSDAERPPRGREGVHESTLGPELVGAGLTRLAHLHPDRTGDRRSRRQRADRMSRSGGVDERAVCEGDVVEAPGPAPRCGVPDRPDRERTELGVEIEVRARHQEVSAGDVEARRTRQRNRREFPVLRQTRFRCERRALASEEDDRDDHGEQRRRHSNERLSLSTPGSNRHLERISRHGTSPPRAPTRDYTPGCLRSRPRISLRTATSRPFSAGDRRPIGHAGGFAPIRSVRKALRTRTGLRPRSSPRRRAASGR